MYSNNFSVRIPEGREVRDQYVEMVHGKTYSIVMRNSHLVPCDAKVTIDGAHVGTWRISAESSIRVERPAGKARLFTFYRLDSIEAGQAGLANNDSLGLVSVEFTPAKRVEVVNESGRKGFSLSDVPCANLTFGSATSRSADGTGLPGSSSQQFSSVGPLDYDYAEAYTIHLRLVAVEEAPAIEPLVPRATPVPPRVG